MRKLSIILLAVFGIAISMSSCKKEYTCECSVADGGTTLATSSVTIKDTKAKAKAACDANQVTYPGTSLSWSCTLK